MDMHAISRWTGTLSGCGGCEWDIADFLKQLADQKKVALSEITITPRACFDTATPTQHERCDTDLEKNRSP
jgi:coenzyme F420-reducing hydrogenase gamma subunit